MAEATREETLEDGDAKMSIDEWVWHLRSMEREYLNFSEETTKEDIRLCIGGL